MKKFISTCLFCIVLFFSVHCTNEILIDKSFNRYYMLEYELEQQNESYDIQIFGSCHAYTSFNPAYLADVYGVSAYNMSNPGESIPVTYLRMLDRFQTDPPKAAIVEIWGVNPYETYDTTENILGGYMQSNLELLPLSPEKLEVIRDFDTLDVLSENFPIAKYKNRLASFSLTKGIYSVAT